MTDDGITETTEATPAAGFADLADQAAAIEGGPPIPGSPAAMQSDAAALDQTTRELLQALTMARALARKPFAWWQDFPTVWGDDTLQSVAASGAAVMQLHGLSFGEFMGKWGPYIGLAFAVGGPAYVTWDAIQLRKRELQAQANSQAQRARDAGQQ